ncbi:protein of unknown function [Rhodovastum atsumiense]|nr:protein of unknown function [Rhodovastum atsumiense]
MRHDHRGDPGGAAPRGAWRGAARRRRGLTTVMWTGPVPAVRVPSVLPGHCEWLDPPPGGLQLERGWAAV